jgi:hypothetical protein
VLSTFSRRVTVVMVAALTLGGCVATAPDGTPASVASPTTGGSTNFASPVPLLQRYPDIGRGGP